MTLRIIQSRFGGSVSAVLGIALCIVAPPGFGATASGGQPSSQTSYRSVSIDGVAIFYREAGNKHAPTILLLHGLPSSSRYFEPLFSRLADRYHLVAPDYPGCGRSDWPNRTKFAYTFDHLADIVTRFTEALGISRYSLYMHDYGGPIGFRMALAHPERIESVIVQNAVAHNEGLGEKWKMKRAFRADRPANEKALRTNLLSFNATRMRHVGSDPDMERYDPDLWTQEFAFLNQPGQSDIQSDLFYDYRRNIELYPKWQAWMRKDQPEMLVLWGKYDPAFELTEPEAYRRDVPGAEVHMLQAGHFALDTAAGETAAIIREFLTRLAAVKDAKPILIDMTAERWQTGENAEFLRELGFYHGLMRLNNGRAVLRDVTFSDGTIEFDVNTIGRGMPGIAFRRQDDKNFELLYLRPDAACAAFQACLQYTPATHGVSLWDFFPRYQTRAPLRENGWNHIKMVVFGRRMNVFVNDAPSPTLQVDRLEGDAMKGGLHLQGPATFANIVITPNAVDDLSPEPASDPLDGDRGLVRNWRLSSFSQLPNGKDPQYAEIPRGTKEWQPIRTERRGLVNISRVYGKPLAEPVRAVAWLQTTIMSDKKQTKKINIGWTRELWVFVNGKLVYADQNLFEKEGARKFPDARCSLENGSFALPLEAGENEIAVAIANDFFGWGIIMRLTDPEGVHLQSE